MAAEDTPALVIVNAGITANQEAIVAATIGLVLMGWNARESDGTPAVATVRVLNGATVAGGTSLLTVELAANQSAGEWYGPGGLDSPNGLSLEVIAGTLDVDIYYKIN